MAQRLVLVERPYLSEHFRQLAARHGLPVVRTEAARALGAGGLPGSLEEAGAIAAARSSDRLLVYTSSENALDWVVEHLAFTHLPALVETFKNKVRFREALEPLYPELFYREVALEDLDALPLRELPYPFVIKPSVGFFSLGVQRVSTPAEWPGVRGRLTTQLEAARRQYPSAVLDATTFIVEEAIDGAELAVDAYYTADGRPVVVGIWEHAFASEADTSDRVYTTSGAIVAEHLDAVTRWLAEVGGRTGARDLPVHVEVRRGGRGLVPIEVNPLRFGGWCTTGDLAERAYGFSPYLLFLEQREPDWDRALAGRDGQRCSVVVLDNTTGTPGREIRDFDYDRLLTRFSAPLELRRVDWTRWPLFGFLFLRTTSETTDELDWVLRSDLSEFIRSPGARAS